jgi:uncharacterized membrane protein
MNKVIKIFVNYFFKGVLIFVPLAFSVYVIYSVVSTVDSIIDLGFPGSGFLVAIVGIAFIGLLVTSFITEPIYNYFDKLLNRMPIFKLMYSSVRDLLEAFVGEDKKFNEPVLVEISEGIKQVGFLTQNNLSSIGLDDEVAVYFPFSYSIAGKVVIVNKSRVSPLRMKAADAMKFVVSGGVSEI